MGRHVPIAERAWVLMYALICAAGRYSTMLCGTFKSGPMRPPSRLIAWQAMHVERKMRKPFISGVVDAKPVGTACGNVTSKGAISIVASCHGRGCVSSER